MGAFEVCQGEERGKKQGGGLCASGIGTYREARWTAAEEQK